MLPLIAIIVINLLTILPHCEALRFPPCQHIGCGYCGTKRMKTQCSSFCDNKCGLKKPITTANLRTRRKTIEEANVEFMNCCKNIDPPVPEACLRVCRLGNTPKQFKDIVFRRPKCSMKFLQQMLLCAARDKDLTDCCLRDESMEGYLSHCQQFCNPSNDDLWDPRFYGKARFLKCVDKLELYNQCYFDAWQ